MTNFEKYKETIIERINSCKTLSELDGYLMVNEFNDERKEIKHFHDHLCDHCPKSNNDNCEGKCDKCNTWLQEAYK